MGVLVDIEGFGGRRGCLLEISRRRELLDCIREAQISSGMFIHNIRESIGTGGFRTEDLRFEAIPTHPTTYLFRSSNTISENPSKYHAEMKMLLPFLEHEPNA